APPVLASIAVTPMNPSLVIGQTQQFTATGTYSDGSTQNITSSATWSSANVSGATISSAGLATAIATGSTTIHAVSGSISGSATLTIAAGAFPWIPYDTWIDFEQGTVGAQANATQLAASTHGVQGVWSVADPNNLLSIQTAAEDPGHAVTGDTGTRGMATNLNSGASAYAEWDPPAQQSSFSIGLWYKTGEAVPWSSGPFFVLFYNNSFGPMIRLSDEKSPYTNVRQIQVSPLNQAVAGVADDTWYWITMKWTQNSQGTMSVYDKSLNLIGTVTFTDAFNVPVQAIRLGNSGSVPEPGAVSYIDDFIVDYTHANFPLLPSIPTAVGLSFNPTTVVNGNTSIGTVTLSAPAPAGGATITLTGSNPAVISVPPSVMVPAGMTTTSFAVSTGGVTFSATGTISATYGSLTATANVIVLPSTMSQIANDNFSRSNSPTLGPNWTPLLGGNNGALKVINGQVQSTALSPAIGKEMYYGGMTWGADQYSEVQIVAASGNGYEGPAVRMTSNDTHYACAVYNTGAGNASVSILIDVGGDNSVLAHSSTATVNQGDTVRCSIQGNVITMTDRTTSSTLLTVTEDTISSGYPGLVDSAGSVSVNNYTLANWATGDIAAPLTLQQVASDNFNRANALNLGSNWHIGPGHGPIQIVSQQTEPYPAGGTPPSKEHYVAAGPLPNDQWSQIQIGAEDLLGDNAAELRASDTVDSMYIADVNLTGAPGVAETRIVSVINGTITPLIIDTTWSTVNQGDYIRGEVRGNLISMIDVTTGSLLLTITDPNVLAGYPGISMQALDGSTADHVAGNWSGGTFH
ncbi:MAG: Ig-like domain-containing protein, partial [Edaphobacter sp.]|uniref:Ig-like domain-containing protein n=1 Tax=Edaphobacter sp. TaxID=1934404 RepID=UPI0029821923